MLRRLKLDAKSDIENMCVAFWCLTPTPDTDNAEVRGIPIPRNAVQGEWDADTEREVMPIRGEKGC
jgi:hypothetical protein